MGIKKTGSVSLEPVVFNFRINYHASVDYCFDDVLESLRHASPFVIGVGYGPTCVGAKLAYIRAKPSLHQGEKTIESAFFKHLSVPSEVIRQEKVNGGVVLFTIRYGEAHIVEASYIEKGLSGGKWKLGEIIVPRQEDRKAAD